MDNLTTVLIITVGLLLGWLLTRRPGSGASRRRRAHQDEEDLDDWDQQDQLEGDEI